MFGRKGICWITVFILAFLCNPAGAEKLTIERCVQIAQEKNPEIRIARENIKRTAADIELSSAQAMPRLTLTYGLTRSDQLFQPVIGGQPLLVTPLVARSGNFILSQPLDVFGIAKLGGRMARLGRDQAQYEYDKTRNDLRFDVEKAFFDILHAEDNVRIRRAAVSQLEAHLSDAQANLKAGTIARFDVLRANTSLANAQLDLITAENGLKLAKSSFNSILGRDLNAPVELDPPASPQHIDVTLNACIDAACSSRPEIEAANTQVELSNKMITIARRTSKPKVGFLWAYDKDYNPTYDNNLSSNWDATIKARVPIIDGGEANAQVIKAKSDSTSANYGLHAALLGIELDVRQAYMNMKESQERIVSAEKGLALAKESMRLAELRYKAGLSTQVETLDAQAALVQADRYHADAIYDYEISVARLEQAVGGPEVMAKLNNSPDKSSGF